ncbi:PKD-like family lipoprotein [Sphingobacterium bovistauri]|uniref:PKD-like family protein n=1 Tax=Sphingobacterium bovistauri TaxID=2781959 RepID=A0ABS7ZB82_9SPHI|nr:PKD-like family lipoprotein [Sphingobacterium bovistauri]MCA5006686.1 hypothetical protein [Sphingobacterium bovistauri]
MKNCIRIILGIFTFAFGSCVKDLGNYEYKVVNEAIVSGIDSIYEIRANDILKINPQVSFSNDPNPDFSNYEYAWYNIGHTGFNTSKPKLISDSLNLDKSIIADFNLGVYNYSFRVTDKRTGVWYEKLFKILISNDIYEGWFVLSEVENQSSRLDMLSFKAKSQSFELMRDILKLKNSPLVLDGIPSFLSVVNYNQLAITTSKVSRIVSANNFTTFPLPNFNNFDSNNYEAIGLNSKFYGANGQKYLTSNGRVFSYQVGTSKYVQKNFMENATDKEFKASPYLSTFNFTDALIFNEDISEFVRSNGVSASKFSLKISNAQLHSLTKDKDLIFARFVLLNGGETLAIMKDKQGDKISLVRIDKEIKNPQSVDMLNSLISQAEFVEFSDDFSYIFYSVGGKLYQYNFSSKLNTLMVDYGNRKISMLKMPKLDFTGVTRSERLENYMKRLFVGSYDAGDLNTSGVLDEYSVPPRGEKLIKVNSFEGLGKIRDMAYRNR